MKSKNAIKILCGWKDTPEKNKEVDDLFYPFIKKDEDKKKM